MAAIIRYDVKGRQRLIPPAMFKAVVSLLDMDGGHMSATNAPDSSRWN
jgi:hypothetical protein